MWILLRKGSKFQASIIFLNIQKGQSKTAKRAEIQKNVQKLGKPFPIFSQLY